MKTRATDPTKGQMYWSMPLLLPLPFMEMVMFLSFVYT
jgi:hypothetical protein